MNGNRVLASGIFHVFLQRERPSAALWHLLILGSCFLVLLWASVREAFPALHLTPVCLQKTRGQFVSFSKLSGTLPVGHPGWQDITGAWPSLETRSELDSPPGLPQAKSLRGSPPSWQQSSLSPGWEFCRKHWPWVILVCVLLVSLTDCLLWVNLSQPNSSCDLPVEGPIIGGNPFDLGQVLLFIAPLYISKKTPRLLQTSPCGCRRGVSNASQWDGEG